MLLVSGPAAGGIRVHLWQLIRSLPSAGFETVLAAPPELVAPAGSRRMDLRLSERLSPLRDIRQVRRLAALQQQWRPQVVHAHGYKAAMLAAVAGGRPLVVTFHNLWPPEAGSLARAGLRFAVGSSVRQIGVSQAVLNSVGAAVGELSTGEVIPNSIEAAHFAELPARAAAREALGLPADAPVIGFAGRLTPVKGPHILLRAAASLVAGHSAVTVVLAGEGPLRGELEGQVHELGLAERVRFLGAAPDIRPLLAAADAWAIPSLAEGGGIVALEAMAAGVPLVASAVGGITESVVDGDSGLLAPPGDPAALADALQRVLADPALASRLSAGGRARARDWPGPEEMAGRVAAIYRSVVGEQ